MKTLLSVSLVTVLFSGCATNIVMEPIGGSRADAVVEMGYYDRGGLSRPNIQWELTNAIALDRCEAWGFKGAVPFTGIVTDNHKNFTTIKYQCTDTK